MARPRVRRYNITWGVPTGLDAKVGKNHRIWREAGNWIADTLGEFMENQKDGKTMVQLDIDGPRMSDEPRLAEIALIMKIPAKKAKK